MSKEEGSKTGQNRNESSLSSLAEVMEDNTNFFIEDLESITANNTI